eukprot:354575-Chlamydomonas_euryale.AAC.16
MQPINQSKPTSNHTEPTLKANQPPAPNLSKPGQPTCTCTQGLSARTSSVDASGLPAEATAATSAQRTSHSGAPASGVRSGRASGNGAPPAPPSSAGGMPAGRFAGGGTGARQHAPMSAAGLTHRWAGRGREGRRSLAVRPVKARSLARSMTCRQLADPWSVSVNVACMNIDRIQFMYV